MNRELNPTAAVETPTRVRYGVLGFACSLSMITYLDRVCFSSAASSIQQALGLNSVADLDLAFTSFAFAYAAFEVPSGWLGDRFGPRNVLIRIVLWWSLFTALTGAIGVTIGSLVLGGFWAMVIVRFLFGIGEAGAYPNITRALHNWFPFQERGFGQGAVWMSGRLMGGLTHLVWLFFTVTLSFTWRDVFWLFGCMGVVWCVLFALWFRNRPEEKATVNAAELNIIRAGQGREEAGHEGVPWRRLLTSGNLWILCMMYFCAAYGWYFNITYLPSFLEQQGVAADSVIGAIYKGGPLLVGAPACLLGGWLTDRHIRRTGDRKWGRRLYGIIGHSCCALFIFTCLFTYYSPFLFFVSISLAAFSNDITMGPAWATCQDIGRRYAAIVAGCMNTIGNMGGALAGWVTGLILKNSLADHAEALNKTVTSLDKAEKAAGLLPGYQINFVVFGIIYVIAVFLWLRIDSTKPVVPEAAAPTVA
jgi:ACS family glucarate transporter-like MFS transporter